MLSENDAKLIAQEMGKVLGDLGLDAKAHADQHRFLSQWMAELERKKARREKLKTSVYGWLIITVIGGIGTLAWKGFQLVVNTPQGVGS